MELQTVRQVSLEYGISNRMLRYYEQIGLIESSRLDDYAYRVYDEANIKRLQQIIILRKLQIPMKQINDIINNQDAVSVIEVFKQNIEEIDEQITALSTIKSILARFVDELQEKADVHLKLDLLNDKTMLAVVNALSFSENKIKEKVSMEELNKVSENLDKTKEKLVRIVYQQPMTMACIDIKTNKEKAYADLKKFITDTNLFKIKPDIKFFTWTHGYSVTIPHNFDVPPPLIKKTYNGGLCAAIRGDEWQFLRKWIENSKEYDWDVDRPVLDEFINAFNIYGLRNADSETFGHTVESFLPIKEMYDLIGEKEKFHTAIMELEKTVSQYKPMEINMTTMIKNKENGIETLQGFYLPLRIELRAKTDGEICIKYGNGYIGFGSHKTGFDSHDGRAALWIDFLNIDTVAHKGLGEIPVGEFVDIEWTLGKEIMIIKINGEIRYCGLYLDYITKFKESPNFNLLATVFVGVDEASTLTVESLRVIEI